MALFTPRTAAEVMRDLLGKVVGRTKLSDINVGSTLHTLLNSVAHEIAATEARMFMLRKSYALTEAVGQDLDARVAELPPVGITRKKATNAAGSVLKITRLDATEELIIPAGSSVTRPDNGTLYETVADVTMAVGELVKEEIYIVCTTVGTSGNCEAGTITSKVNFPSEIDEVTNPLPLTSGVDRELDSSLRARALRYVNSLGRTTKSSLEFLGLSFVSSDNVSFPFAKVYEDPENPGYAELVVDDGTGLKNPPIIRGEDRLVRIPTGGTRFITHQRPATRPVRRDDMTITDSDGNEVNINDTDFISIPERGVVYFKDGVLPEGGTVNIRFLRLYTGIIKELQEEIEGSPNNGEQLTGWRSAGCRVRVVPPIVDDIAFDIAIIVRPEFNFDVVSQQVKNASIAYVNRTGIGEPFLVSKLIAHLMRTQSIEACSLFVKNTNTPLDNIYTTSTKSVIRIAEEDITVKSSI